LVNKNFRQRSILRDCPQQMQAWRVASLTCAFRQMIRLSSLKQLKLRQIAKLNPMQSKVVTFSEIGEPKDVLTIQMHTVADAPSHPVIVRMLFAPINPADGLRLRGKFGFSESFPAVVGGEGVGVVHSISADSSSSGLQVWKLARAHITPMLHKATGGPVPLREYSRAITFRNRWVTVSFYLMAARGHSTKHALLRMSSR
jgi:hypothetical protein